MRFPKAWFWFGLGILVFACSSPNNGTNFNYLRSPSFFGADTIASDNPFCDGTQPFASKDACLAAKKYQLTWERPEDTAQLLGYRIYLDTLQDPRAPAGKHWDYVRDRPELASIIVNSTALKDTLIFVFGSGGFAQDTLTHGQRKIVLMDSSNRSEPQSGRLVFGLVPVYGGGVTAGQPQFAYFKTTDKDPPDPFHPLVKAMATQISVAWARPTDRTNFFDPSQDTGIIRSYRLRLALSGRATPDRKAAFKPKISLYLVGEKDMTPAVSDSLDNDTFPSKYTFRLPDSNRASKRTSAILADSMHVLISNVKPLDTLQLTLYAIDNSGNQNDSAMETITLYTTDTTQPSKPLLSVDSLTRNGFTVSWTASSDTVQTGDVKQAGPHPNYNIQKYLLTRILLRPPGAKVTSLDHVDTTITPLLADSVTDKFSVTMKFLPPGTRFYLSLMAVDNTGYESDTDSLTVATDSVRFAGADSALTCPAGFIPIPSGQFKLGDDSPAAGADEVPAHIVTMASYCIEPYEHRDTSSNRFVSNVTFDAAAKACADIDPSFETKLCSEAEWERSCEGPATDSTALLHGIQSENKDPSILQTSCNQGTNDSAMAMSFALRNSVCLTTEGVYDMAGNLSEWVRDPYVATAYSGLTDTLLTHDFTFADSATDPSHITLRGLRGGNYLKTGLTQSATQNLARCSNRDFAEQVRPVFRQDCVDPSKPKIAIIYGSGLTGHRCIDLPSDTLPVAQITDIIPSPRDTSGNTLVVFLAGDPVAHNVAIPLDTAFTGRKPISAQLTTKSLAIVAFQNVANPQIVIPDTLDANEMKDTSQASLAKIFTREAGNADWSAQKDASGNYKIEYQYAYTVLGTKPARAFYSNRAIGFRCCSLAKSAAPPAITANP